MTEEMDQRAAPEQAGEAPGEGSVEVTVTAAELAAVRELALKAHPDAVPELVGGATVAEVMASLEPARAAYRRVAEAATAAAEARPPAAGPVVPVAVPVVPAGDAPRFAVDVETLPAAEKIRRGLANRSQR